MKLNSAWIHYNCVCCICVLLYCVHVNLIKIHHNFKGLLENQEYDYEQNYDE